MSIAAFYKCGYSLGINLKKKKKPSIKLISLLKKTLKKTLALYHFQHHAVVLRSMPPRTSLRRRVAHTLHRPFPFSISIGHHRPIPSSVLRALSLWAAIAIIIKLPNQKLVFPKLLWSTLSYAIGQNSLSLSLFLSHSLSLIFFLDLTLFLVAEKLSKNWKILVSSAWYTYIWICKLFLDMGLWSAYVVCECNLKWV